MLLYIEDTEKLVICKSTNSISLEKNNHRANMTNKFLNKTSDDCHLDVSKKAHMHDIVSNQI